MNEVVRDAVDVLGNADRVHETEDKHHPKRDAWKKIKHAEEVSAVDEVRRGGNCVPARVRKDPRVGLGAPDAYEFAR